MPTGWLSVATRSAELKHNDQLSNQTEQQGNPPQLLQLYANLPLPQYHRERQPSAERYHLACHLSKVSEASLQPDNISSFQAALLHSISERTCFSQQRFCPPEGWNSEPQGPFERPQS